MHPDGEHQDALANLIAPMLLRWRRRRHRAACLRLTSPSTDALGYGGPGDEPSRARRARTRRRQRGRAAPGACARRAWRASAPSRPSTRCGEGALLVDTRTFEQRRVQGDVPGALRIDRTVFEWRLDPTGPWCIPQVTGPDARIIVMCRQGFSSSLAAASLQAIGLHQRDRHRRGLRSVARRRPARRRRSSTRATPTDQPAHPAGGSVSGSG